MKCNKIKKCIESFGMVHGSIVPIFYVWQKILERKGFTYKEEDFLKKYGSVEAASIYQLKDEFKKKSENEKINGFESEELSLGDV